MSLKFAVIGDPIAHSLSPAMQNAALQALNMDASYDAIHVRPEELEAFVRSARERLNGFNITVPHKNAIIPFLDSISEEAAAAGSVNTVLCANGKLHGETTDGYGLAQALREAFHFQLSGCRGVTFLGCGGAAQAAAVHFALCGAERIFLLNRTVAKADALAERIHSVAPRTTVRTGSIGDAECVGCFLRQSGAAVQCTSLGLREEDPAPFDLRTLPRDIVLYDTIYKRTKLVLEAERRGIPIANGLGMLLHQGARSLSMWLEKEPPVEVMRRALDSAYRGRTEAR